MKNKNKNNKQYCVYCGEENNIKDKRCSKCHRKLNPKSHDFLDYLKKHIKSDLKSNVEDKTISIITKYLKSHLYGLILTFSVIASAAVVVHVNAIDNGVQKVESKPTNIEETIKYAGEGLSSEEVVNLYVDALKNKDMNLIESLQYDTFFDISDDIQLDDIYDYSRYSYCKPTTSHELVDNIDVYFENLYRVNIYYYGFAVRLSVRYDGHLISPYTIRIYYCLDDNCDEHDDGYNYHEIQVIETDGNYYILGELIDF